MQRGGNALGVAALEVPFFLTLSNTGSRGLSETASYVQAFGAVAFWNVLMLLVVVGLLLLLPTSGLAGGYMLAHLLEQGGWDIVAVSRRKPRIPGDYQHIAVDLLDPADCRTKLGPLTNISHLFYLAITERSDPGETVSANSNMFFNLVKTVEAVSPALEHVHLSQGTRWYGNHLGPYKTPTKEDDPRHMPPGLFGAALRW